MNILSPLRDVSNNGDYATPSPGAKGKRSRMFVAASTETEEESVAVVVARVSANSSRRDSFS